jgi:hypothetical protein
MQAHHLVTELLLLLLRCLINHVLSTFDDALHTQLNLRRLQQLLSGTLIPATGLNIPSAPLQQHHDDSHIVHGAASHALRKQRFCSSCGSAVTVHQAVRQLSRAQPCKRCNNA